MSNAMCPMGCKIYLEGIEMNNVTAFNIAEGWVECWTSSPSHYSTEDSTPGDIMRSRLYGFVEVERK